MKGTVDKRKNMKETGFKEKRPNLRRQETSKLKEVVELVV